LDTPADSLPIDDLDSFRDLMRRVRDGSEDAAWELVERYGGYVRRAVRRALDRRLRPKFDSLDFVQLVWQSFFRMHDQANRFERPQHLVVFLAGVAANKVHMEGRRQLTTKKHDLQREVPLVRPSGKVREEIAGREPEPVDVAIARERWERIVQDLPADQRCIIQLRLRGKTAADIGRILGVNAQTVRRFLDSLLQATGP
jgi:RNA polymerase sigma-70 factor (ECF subfamily)